MLFFKGGIAMAFVMDRSYIEEWCHASYAALAFLAKIPYYAFCVDKRPKVATP